jgi:4-amino-4-deoxy-L-arabinose transferase-like glycosyltransferase
MEKNLFGWREADEKINVPEILGNFRVNFCTSKHELQRGDNIYYFLSLKYPCNERKPMVGFVQVSAIGWKRRENRKNLGFCMLIFLVMLLICVLNWNWKLLNEDLMCLALKVCFGLPDDWYGF